MKQLVVIIVLALASCTYTNKNGTLALGGKGAARGEGWAVVWDNEASFREGALLAGVAVGAWQAVAVNKAAEQTARVINTNATQATINASNNATAVELGAQGVQGAAIGAGVSSIPK